MQEFEFTLKFAFSDVNTNAEDFIEALGEAGCSDAIIGMGQKGRIAFDFAREANNATDAILASLDDIKKVIPTAKLIECTPDIVGLSDMADYLGFSRQYMRKLMLANPNTFPVPIHSGKTSIWHLSNILEWNNLKQIKAVDSSIKEVVLASKQINIVKDYMNVKEAISQKLTERFSKVYN